MASASVNSMVNFCRSVPPLSWLLGFSVVSKFTGSELLEPIISQFDLRIVKFSLDSWIHSFSCLRVLPIESRFQVGLVKDGTSVTADIQIFATLNALESVRVSQLKRWCTHVAQLSYNDKTDNPVVQEKYGVQDVLIF